jgi:20S proteasome alpha/beta subunit
MTVIAFDGNSVAADRQATIGMNKNQCTKIFAHGGCVLAISGYGAGGMALVDWWKSGGDKSSYPKAADGFETTLYVFQLGNPIKLYSRTPHCELLECEKTAFGCGADYAIGAMDFGANAVQAVECASRHSTGCGMGVDVLYLR